ncbi:MAG: CPBP family intramembrane metalloprotease [Deltaproteobacteria bacterium]|nr:CPBP family intramembrane metalloprotease [Deltaproteobacteria bacterium]
MPGGASQRTTAGREGHGWWPYLVPYIGFLLAVELARRVPEAAVPLMHFVKPAVPVALLVYFWRRGAYAELRRIRLTAGGALLDIGVGIALALLWMAPYILLPDLRPDASEAFDATLMGERWVALVLGVRLFGYAIVTPIFEELFIRSFVMRFAEVYWQNGDFRDVPLAQYSLKSFLATIVVFTIGHVPWEWWVAIPWVALTNLWFYYRRDLGALMLVHGTTNAALLAFAFFGGGLFTDPGGAPISLWFFV